MSQTHTFQTEVQQLLHLMIHSLYSEREIFLRELLSNASDACDKLRFQALTAPELLTGDPELGVTVVGDAEALTVTITDNGVGMTEAEAMEHLGTIAKSGTKAFLNSLDASKVKDTNLIGQFGVGFYSAFMVADRIVVESRSAHVAADQATRWESRGDGSYTTEALTRTQRGTTITLHLKEDAKEFAESWRIRALVKKYSDYVAYPIRSPKYLSDDDKKAGKTADLEQINAGAPLWTRAKDDITDEQYTAFYQAACKQWDTPATRVHVNVEGTLAFTTLLFIPSERPFDMFDRDRKGLSLYVRRVFIMDDCTDLLPEYLRFVRGIVDSDDLPLNVSREMLQQQDVVPKLRKLLVKRILDHLLKLAEGDEAAQATFAKIDAAFGIVLREGLVSEHDSDLKAKIGKLIRFRSTWTMAQEPADDSRRTSFADYVSRMADGQKGIYYVTAPNLAAATSAPQLEGFNAKNVEVLLLAEPVDEWIVGQYTKHGEHDLISVAKGESDLADAETKQRLEEQNKAAEGFLGAAKEALAEDIDVVRFTARLKDSPCCLVGAEHMPAPWMEEMLRRSGQSVPKSKRSLELNPDHPLIQRLQALHGLGKTADVKQWLGVLRDQAVIAEGGRLADASAFAKSVQELLLKAVPAAEAKG